MPRPRTVDLLVRQAVAKELNRFFAQSRTSKAVLAKRLGISRQALYTYTSGTSTPSAEVLARLASIEGIRLYFHGKRFDPGPSNPTDEQSSASKQWDLPFDTPILLTGDTGPVRVEIVRKQTGVVELAIQLRAS